MNTQIESPSMSASAEFLNKKKLLLKMQVFKRLSEIDDYLRAKAPFDELAKQIREAFAAMHPDVEVPCRATLHHLYERAIDAAGDRMWVAEMKQLANSAKWKIHRKWIGSTIMLAENLKYELTNGSPEFLSTGDFKRTQSAARSLQKLLIRFQETKRFNEQLDETAAIVNWRDSLRLARKRLRRTLQRECASLSKTHHVELIRLVIERTGLNPNESEDAVSRMLRPSRQSASPEAKTAKARKPQRKYRSRI